MATTKIRMVCNNVNKNAQLPNNTESVQLVSHSKDGKQLQEGVTGSINITRVGEQLNGTFSLSGPTVPSITSISLPTGIVQNMNLEDEIVVMVDMPE